MKILFLLALLHIAYIANAEKIKLIKDLVYAPKTKVVDGRQIVTLEFFKKQKFDFVLDYKTRDFLIPGEGFKPAFDCDTNSRCIPSQDPPVPVSYEQIVTDGQKVKTLIQFKTSKAPKDLQEDTLIDAFKTKKDPEWRIGEKGVLGLRHVSDFLSGFSAGYENDQDGFDLEYFSKIKREKSGLASVDSFKLHFSTSDSMSTSLVNLGSDWDFKLTMGLTKEAQELFFIFDNTLAAYIGLPYVDTEITKLNELICQNPAGCKKTDDIDLGKAPELVVTITSAGSKSIRVKSEDYTYYDEEGNLRYYIVKSSSPVLGFLLFSEETDASLIYRYNKKTKIAYGGFGFDHGKKATLKRVTWFIYGLIGACLLCCLLTIVGIVFCVVIASKKSKDGVDSSYQDI